MGVSAETIRRDMIVAPTPMDKGLTLTIQITAYDNGLLQVDGRPIDDRHGWSGAHEVVSALITAFYRQVRARRGE